MPRLKNKSIATDEFRKGIADRNIILGQLLRLARSWKNKTLAEVGDDLGCDYQKIQGIESGRNLIKAGELLMLAEYYRVPLEFFSVANMKMKMEEFSTFPELEFDAIPVSEFMRIFDTYLKPMFLAVDAENSEVALNRIEEYLKSAVAIAIQTGDKTDFDFSRAVDDFEQGSMLIPVPNMKQTKANRELIEKVREISISLLAMGTMKQSKDIVEMLDVVVRLLDNMGDAKA